MDLSFQKKILKIKTPLEAEGAVSSESWIQDENYFPDLGLPLTSAMLKQMIELRKVQFACDGNDYQKSRVFVGDKISIPREKTVLSLRTLILRWQEEHHLWNV